MTTKRATVIQSAADSSIVLATPQCEGCQRCHQGQNQMLPIDGTFEGEVDLHLSLRDQCFALLNSLLLPLLISLVFAFVADYLHLSEIYGIISAVCGFSIGVLWCRQLKPDALTVKQVHRG